MKKIWLFPWMFLLFPGGSWAQTETPLCPATSPREYALLVVTPAADSQQQLKRTLPNNTTTTLCRYQESLVTRITGFPNLQEAREWGNYVKEIVGLEAYIARPPELPGEATPVVITPNRNNRPSFSPQRLGSGYAVLVDYFNQPPLATQLKEAMVGKDVGLATYAQRPYLLAVYTQNQGEANQMLKRLSDRGFVSILVDSRRVTLLKEVVSYR